MKIPAQAWSRQLPNIATLGQRLRQLDIRKLRLSELPRLNTRRLMRRLGWPGMAAGALLAVVATFYFSAIRPAEARLDEARDNTHSLYDRLRQGNSAAKPPAMQLAEFYHLFPRERDLPERLEKIFTAAEEQGITLEQGEYKFLRPADDRLMRVQITLPIKGGYPQIRKFLDGLPQVVPTVALGDIQFERQRVADPIVEAKIKLVLFLEQES